MKTIIHNKNTQSALGTVLIIIFILMVNSGYAQYMKIISVKHLDPVSVQKGLNRVIAYSQKVYGGGVALNEWNQRNTGTLSVGDFNGISFNDLKIELVSLSGDTGHPSATLHLMTPQEDRDVTLTQNFSQAIGNYRVRVTEINYAHKEVSVDVWQINQPVMNPAWQHPPGKVNVTADSKRSSVTITADYAADVQHLSEWVDYWDQPSTVSYMKSLKMKETAFTKKDSDQLTQVQNSLDQLKLDYEKKKISFQEFQNQNKGLERKKNDILYKLYLEPEVQ